MRIVFSFLALIPLWVIGQEQYRIVGDIQQLKNYDMIYLEYGFADNQKKDSARIVDGKFEFKGEVDEPTYATLNLRTTNRNAEGPNYMELYLSKGDIRIVSEKLDTKALVGNELNESFAKYTKGKEPFWAWRREKDVFLNSEAVSKGLEGERAYEYAFLTENPLNYHSLLLISRLLDNKNVLELEDKFKQLLRSYKATKIAVTLGKRIDKYKKVAIGSTVKDFRMLDTLGNSLQLSDFKGKNVLINFWVFNENSNREGFKELHYRLKEIEYDDLVVLHVHIPFDFEKEKSSWLKAIETDQLNFFRHVIVDSENSKLLFSNYTTDMRGPSIGENFNNYLLDKEGVIVAYGIRARNIKEKLSILEK